MTRVERAQHLEYDAARRRRRHRVNVVAFVAMVNRVAPVGTIVREIGSGEESTVRFHERDERGGNVAVIIVRDRVVAQALQRRREILRDYRVAGLERRAVGLEENLAQPWI